jgi:ATP-binding cassette subfamily B protein/ATP-binding cassette subfamily C protein
VAVPELRRPDWLVHGDEVVATSFLAMARRLPALLAAALRLGWAASRRDTAVAITLTLGAGTLTGAGVLAIRGVAGALLAGGPTPQRLRAALPSLLVVAAALGARSVLSTAAGWAQARLTPQVSAVSETRLMELTTRVDLAAFDDPGFADDMERARARGVQSASTIVEQAVDLLTGLVGVGAAGVALLVVHPVLLPLLAVAVAPVGWAAVRAARVQYLSLHRRVARRRRLWLLEHLMADRDTAAELRSYGMRGFLLDQHRSTVAAETAADLAVVRSQTATRAAGGGLGGLATVGVYVALGWLLTAGRVPLAAAAAGVVALQSGRQALQLFVVAANGLYEDALYFRDYTDFCDRAAAQIRTGAAGGRPPVPFAELVLDEVSLTYPGAAEPAVDRVSLTIRRGEIVALVGENGSGKTSLARLLAALYAPTAGEIRWDGAPVTDVPPDWLRRHIAVISQEYQHWPFTAGDNIRVGDTDRELDPTGQEVYAAARAAGAHEMIEALPNGYDTLLHRMFAGGQELSGGQWQRLAAARGLYRSSPLLICDEPSAALDARAEYQLFQQLCRPGATRTTVLISHRLANVRHVDRIYVMHAGRIVEQGTHAELIATGGRYAELFTLQASGYREAARTLPEPVPGRP